MIDPEETTIYTCRILDSGQGTPIFEIEPGDQPGVKVAAGTATGAWAQVFKAANKIRDRVHSNSVSGPDYYGLGQSTIKALIQELPGASELPDYVMQNYFEAGSASANKLTEKDADDYEPGSGKKGKKGKQPKQGAGGATGAGGKKGSRKSGARSSAAAAAASTLEELEAASIEPPSDPAHPGYYPGSGSPPPPHHNDYYAAQGGAATPGGGGHSINNLLHHPADSAAAAASNFPGTPVHTAIDPALQASGGGGGAPPHQHQPQHSPSSPYESPNLGYSSSSYYAAAPPPPPPHPSHQQHPSGGRPNNAHWSPSPTMGPPGGHGQSPYLSPQQQQQYMYGNDPAYAHRSRSTSGGSH
jgi:hypothetical protein